MNINATIELFRAAYANHSKEIWALTILTFINRMGTMVMPFLSVYLTAELGYSLKETGFIISAFGFGGFGGAYFGGRLADRYGANSVILASLIIGGLFFIALQWVTSISGLFVMIFLTALFGEAYRPAIMVAIGDYTPKEERGRATALNRLAINLGMSTGPFVGGFVAVILGYHWLFWLDGITCVLAGVYFWKVSKTWRMQTSKEKNIEKVETTFKKPYQNTSFLIFLAATFLMGLSYMQWFYTVPVFLKTEWNFDERYIGILMTVSSLLIILLEMPIVHHFEQRKKVKFSILLGLGIISFCYLPFLFSKALFWCFVSVILWTVGEIFFFSFNNAEALNRSPEGQTGVYMAWYWMAWSVIGIVGPFMGLSIADTFGFDVFWILLTVLFLLSWLMMRRLHKRD